MHTESLHGPARDKGQVKGADVGPEAKSKTKAKLRGRDTATFHLVEIAAGLARHKGAANCRTRAD